MGSYVISVSLGTGCYRHIQIAASATLFKLHEAILNAFDFVDDHAHAFFMDNRVWSDLDAYYSMDPEDCNRTTDQYTLATAGLSVGSKFKYLFDYGEEWTFQCKVLRVLEERTDIPYILRSVGESPEQYPDFEDDWDGEDEEDWDDEEDEEDWDDEEDDDEDWVDADGFPTLPQKVKNSLYAMLHLEQEVIDSIHQYMAAAERLYGTIPLKKLYEIYNSQNPPVSEEAFLIIGEICIFEENAYMVMPRNPLPKRKDPQLSDLDLVSLYLLRDGDIEDYLLMCQAQEGKPCKILPKEEFLRYAEEDYYPTTPENIAMLNFFRRRRSSLSKSPEELCTILQILITLDACLEDILEVLEQEGLTFQSQTAIEEFLPLFQDLNNHTPKHVNRGYTPSELASIYLSQPIPAAPEDADTQLSLFDEILPPPKSTITGTPARNAPCPCGSGKKYKNCCGKR